MKKRQSERVKIYLNNLLDARKQWRRLRDRKYYDFPETGSMPRLGLTGLTGQGHQPHQRTKGNSFS
jgi:hypothetical protein